MKQIAPISIDPSGVKDFNDRTDALIRFACAAVIIVVF